MNADDETVWEMKNKTKNLFVSYGFKEGADILASSDNIFYSESGRPEGVIFRIDQEGRSFPLLSTEYSAAITFTRRSPLWLYRAV